jgi:hypothetical protein
MPSPRRNRLADGAAADRGTLQSTNPKKAADQDYTFAQYRLALIFYFDHKDFAKALYTTRQPLDADLVKAIEQTGKEQMQKLDDQDDDQDPVRQGGLKSLAAMSGSL